MRVATYNRSRGSGIGDACDVNGFLASRKLPEIAACVAAFSRNYAARDELAPHVRWLPAWQRFQAKHAIGLNPGVGTGSMQMGTGSHQENALNSRERGGSTPCGIEFLPVAAIAGALPRRSRCRRKDTVGVVAAKSSSSKATRYHRRPTSGVPRICRARARAGLHHSGSRDRRRRAAGSRRDLLRRAADSCARRLIATPW